MVKASGIGAVLSSISLKQWAHLFGIVLCRICRALMDPAVGGERRPSQTPHCEGGENQNAGLRY